MVFIKWPKTYRIPVSQIKMRGKHYLSSKEVKKLLNGNIIISEKYDGANVGIIKTEDYFRLQKRGSLVDQSEHEQFNRFKAWSQINYDKLMKIPKNTILYGEWCNVVHTIYYDKLPDYFLAFGLLNKDTKTFYHWDHMKELCDNIGISTVPVLKQITNIHKDKLFDLIPKKSNFGSGPAEGLVVYNYKQQMRGKIVKEGFTKKMDKSGHWMHKKITFNKLGK